MVLEAVIEKLKWTRHHFDILNRAVTDYTDQKNTQFFVKRYNETKTMAWGHFDSVSGPPTKISNIFGDVLQSANSCLDYLVCELFGRQLTLLQAMESISKKTGNFLLWLKTFLEAVNNFNSHL
jgi:hypothetical protein